MSKGQEQWKTYLDKEMQALSPHLSSLGITLDEKQPHTMGERFLMQAVTTASGKKLILLGEMDNKRVVIKATREAGGIKEIEDERASRAKIQRLDFASDVFVSPKELLHTKRGGFLISIQEYIEQNSTFLNRPLEDQFMFALNAFKSQEGTHAATHGHTKTIHHAFSIFTEDDYLKNVDSFIKVVENVQIEDSIIQSLKEARGYLEENKKTIEQYCNFLVHTDFVPHNFRIHHETMYLLDHSSIRFGNKYEGWARFLNFMTLYNPKLEQLLTDYVHQNRTHEEHLSLKLMRIYRLCEIISYYAGTLERSSGALLELNATRVHFWHEVLRVVLADSPLPEHIRETYIHDRDRLRSQDEKKRQENLH